MFECCQASSRVETQIGFANAQITVQYSVHNYGFAKHKLSLRSKEIIFLVEGVKAFGVAQSDTGNNEVRDAMVTTPDVVQTVVRTLTTTIGLLK